MKSKIVYLNDLAIGTARTWHEAAQLVGSLLKRAVTMREAQNHGNEGPEGFYISLRR